MTCNEILEAIRYEAIPLRNCQSDYSTGDEATRLAIIIKCEITVRRILALLDMQSAKGKP